MPLDDPFLPRLLDTVLAMTRVVPPSVARWAGGMLGWFYGGLPLREQRRTRENLRRAFPSQTPAWIERTSRKCFRHFGRMGAWSLATATHTPQRLMRRCAYEGEAGLRALDHACRRGEGTVMFTGHYGNWELACRIGAVLFPATVIGKRLRNRHIDELVVRMRRSGGAEQLYQDEDIRHSLRALRRGRILCTLADQDIPRLPGIHVPWFGVPAYTPIAPAALAMLGGGLVQMVFCFESHGRWVLHFSERRHIARGLDRAQGIREITTWATAYEEALVRRHPEQWVWWHMRWRTPVPPSASAALTAPP
jgi:KDO2-lipid IV(A) lauroyltransferase